MLHRLAHFIAVSLVGALLSSAALAADKPNIVILFADDLGYADLGSYGNPYIRTPNLDRMASEGQRWTDFYVAAPVCSPSRGALLTGQLSVRTGLFGRRMHVMFPEDPNGIPAQQVTLAEALQSAGYRTGMFGKWHLGDAPANFPTRNGFDYWYGVPYSNDMDLKGVPGETVVRFMSGRLKDEAMAKQIAANYASLPELMANPRSEYWNVPLWRSQRQGKGFKDEMIERPVQQPTFTQRLTEEATRFIRESGDQPFLVYLPYSMPHLPIFASDDFKGRSLRGAYGDTVEELDWSVGRIRATLEELGLAENTLVLFTSDNGPWQQASIPLAGSAGMLHGSKGTTWEGGMRVPGVFWWPGRIKPAVISDIGTTMDVYVTALKLAGATAPAVTDGFDLSATLFDGAAGPRQEFPYYHKGYLKAYRKGNYKIQYFGGEGTDQELPAPKLYDLRQDISEMTDIAQTSPAVLQDMEAAVARHRATVQVAEPIFDLRLKD